MLVKKTRLNHDAITKRNPKKGLFLKIFVIYMDIFLHVFF